MRRLEGDRASRPPVRLAFTSISTITCDGSATAAQHLPYLAPLLRLPVDQLGQRLHIRHSNREQIVE